jgi:hypothetical protein
MPRGRFVIYISFWVQGQCFFVSRRLKICIGTAHFFYRDGNFFAWAWKFSSIAVEILPHRHANFFAQAKVRFFPGQNRNPVNHWHLPAAKLLTGSVGLLRFNKAADNINYFRQ